MSNQGQQIDSTATLFKQAILAIGVAYCAIAIFPFVRINAKAEASPLAFQHEYADLNASFSKEVLNDKAEKTLLAFADSSIQCPIPHIPKVSTTPSSEVETINHLNRWITCHNAWTSQLRRQMEERVLNFETLNPTHSRSKTNPVSLKREDKLEVLISNDRKTVDYISANYVEWKINSLRYKRRLEFRRNLMTEQETSTTER